MMAAEDLGPVYTPGKSFRSRAEARQREYRAGVLKVGWYRYGHWLDTAATTQGKNFVVPEAFEQARARAATAKGVQEQRTFPNMLSSQAMCFNLFSPMARDTRLATTVLRQFFPEVAEVLTISLEYTPSNTVFGDQSGLVGVDCDLLVDAAWSDGSRAVITIEVKFVEKEFSACGFRKAGKRAKGTACPDDIPVAADHGVCLYAARKDYGYWRQTARLATLRPSALPSAGCPFGGPEWQLWVNHTLAHAEADARGAHHAIFAVCAPTTNTTLLRDDILDRFQARLAKPATFRFVPLDDLINHIGALSSQDSRLKIWADSLAARYSAI
jgi:hypothetical protein